jgi:hypothetical protein
VGRLLLAGGVIDLDLGVRVVSRAEPGALVEQLAAAIGAEPQRG